MRCEKVVRRGQHSVGLFTCNLDAVRRAVRKISTDWNYKINTQIEAGKAAQFETRLRLNGFAVDIDLPFGPNSVT